MNFEKRLEELSIEFISLQKQIDKQKNLENIKPAIDFAEIIRLERVKQNLTQKTLSELSGVSESSMQKIERGDHSIKFKIIMDVVNALGMNLWIG